MHIPSVAPPAPGREPRASERSERRPGSAEPKAFRTEGARQDSPGPANAVSAALGLRTEGARQDSPGLANAVSAALGQQTPRILARRRRAAEWNRPRYLPALPYAFSVQEPSLTVDPGRRSLRSLALGYPALHLRCEDPGRSLRSLALGCPTLHLRCEDPGRRSLRSLALGYPALHLRCGMPSALPSQGGAPYVRWPCTILPCTFSAKSAVQ